MEFYRYPLTKLFDIPQIITIRYFEYGKDLLLDSESHDFWEFLYVDRGEAAVTSETSVYHLKKGNIIFHKPNQVHTVAAVGAIAPNLVTAAFVCQSPAMQFFENQIFRLGEHERCLLATAISEASNAFSTPPNNPCTTRLTAGTQPLPGAEQMIQMALEEFLISLYRKNLVLSEMDTLSQCSSSKDCTSFSNVHLSDTRALTKSVRLKRDAELFAHITAYMETHLCQSLTVDQICHDNLIGLSQLQKLFRSQCGCGIIEYFSHMKINRAKELIREQSMNFTQIADYLGYASIHYFSRQFKKIAGITPSEYALSAKEIAEQEYF